MSELLELAKRCEKAKRQDNNLDVLIEVAMFKPDDEYISAEPNNAGTKVVYTDVNGGRTTVRAKDYTLTKGRRIFWASHFRTLHSIMNITVD